MANRVEPGLIPALFEELQSERFVTVSTVDYETNGPNVSAISWILAKDEQTLLFAVDQLSRIVKNIKDNPLVVVNLIANESTYSIAGKAGVSLESLSGVPLKLALIQLAIHEVRDVMFYGSKISTEPAYEKTYDKTAADRLDRQVIEAMKKA
ncbi:pyridoxamine 5'-phosphate oxidase family protein [Rossellomorea sp. YZS02]|uniref:pyridoxamine 5'-phosphate oxidase family protein n=1 Tax=Rossellomorea sp. YZS02 TaxID=3097358 RepID=UPI002A17D684|nr:pyridoxamine 5'-phosphate oxidase family protein [Rossellomorea sp. YZS02]MDX8342952.1 pyridoxamine 5'-phosphate oxidase family protein [Rossellomorea sp. YZS02]